MRLTPKMFKNICAVVENATGVDDVMSKTRRREVVDARRISFRILRNVYGLSFQRIGDLFDKNHASVLHSLKDFDFILNHDDIFQNNYNKCMSALGDGESRKAQSIHEMQQLQEEFLTLTYNENGI